jgi:hypothetical protein
LIGTRGRELSRLRARLYALMASPPVKARQYASSGGWAHAPRPAAPLSGRELQNFVAAGELMNDDDQDAIIRIIEEQDPDVELSAGKALLDATGLGLAAIYALREDMKGALEKRGQKYPE